MSLTDRLARFTKHEDGAVAVIVALLLTVLLGFVALSVDVAYLYRERAQLQSVSDLAAMSAMAAPNDPVTRANFAIARNSMPEDALDTLQSGRYLRNPAIAPRDRFTALPAGNPNINAVRVTLQSDAALNFARIFTDDDHVTLDRTALATRTGAASFSLNSHLVNLDAASLNQALALRFGVGATLGVGDMSLLAGADVDLGALLAALDAQTGGPTRNPAGILTAVPTVRALVEALQSVLPPSVAQRLTGLATAAGSETIAVSSLIGGLDAELGLTASEFLSQINLSALDVVAALIANAARDQGITIGTEVTVPGVVSAATTLTAGEPPARSGWIALGEAGVQLHRAALRLRTDLAIAPGLLGNLGVGVQVARINLPLYVEVAGSTATLNQIGCNLTAPQDVAARFLTAHAPLHPANGTSVAALYLGTLAAGVSATAPINPADLGFADLLDLDIVIALPLVPDLKISGLTIQARSRVMVGASQSQTITFTKDDIAADRTTKSYGSGNLLSSAIADLLSPDRTEIRIKPSQASLATGIAAPVVAGVLNLLPERLLSGLAAPIDSVLDATLSSVGIDLGVGELTLTGHHCEPIRLVR